MADDDPEEKGILSPDEIDITDDENVSELEEGRYLISPGDDGPDESVEVHDHDRDRADPDPDGEDDPAATPEPRSLDAATVNDWLDEHVGGTGAEYGFHVTATFEGRVVRQELYSDDVVTTFENLLTWYAQQVSRDTPVEEALAILLLEANVPVRFPASVAGHIVEEAGLEPEDDIAELLAAVEESGGLRLPSRR